MIINGVHISQEILHRINTCLVQEPGISRSALSRKVCEWLDWRSPNGKLKEQSCRKLLRELAHQQKITLPPVAVSYSFHSKPNSKKKVSVDIAPLSCSLEELGDIDIVPVTSRYCKTSHQWNALMDTYHYLGSGPLCGAQIRYLVSSTIHGYIGALSFSAATRRLKQRDKWIGWSSSARHANLQRVVNNSRFLIVPSVHVPNLASHILSKSTKRLAADWEVRYGYRPVLVETFVDPERYSGTCYRAANWIYMKQTAGRSSPYRNGKKSSGKKDVFVYPLHRCYRSILCKEPAKNVQLRSGICHGEKWYEQEFGRVDVYDNRLKRRLYSLAEDFFARPGALLPEALGGSEAKVRAAHRFFSNKEISMDTILTSHFEATIERMGSYSVILAAQDTSSLNYTGHASDDMGPLNHTKDTSIGLLLHDTMAFTPEGVPLGLLDIQLWARDKTITRKKDQRHILPIEEKESFKWLKSYRAVAEAQKLCPETMIVSVGDRESDIYELLYEAYQGEKKPELLIRAEKTRKRKVGGVYLWTHMEKQPVSGYQEVFIPGKSKKSSRTAKLEVRYSEVSLSAPKDSKLPNITAWAVNAREIEAAADVTEPVDWMLLTTVETKTFKKACERIRWYSHRWGIEVYHKVLKSGCRIEDRHLSTVARLETCMAIDFVIAWRVYWLIKHGRETPDLPCDIFLSEEEWKALCCYKIRKIPDKPPSLRDAVRMIASLGGFLGRRCDGEPGVITTWRGIQRLADISLGFRLATSNNRNRDGP